MVLILLAVWYFMPRLFWKTENQSSLQTDWLTTKPHSCCIKVSLNDLKPLETKISKVLNNLYSIKNTKLNR